MKEGNKREMAQAWEMVRWNEIVRATRMELGSVIQSPNCLEFARALYLFNGGGENHCVDDVNIPMHHLLKVGNIYIDGYGAHTRDDLRGRWGRSKVMKCHQTVPDHLKKHFPDPNWAYLYDTGRVEKYLEALRRADGK